MLLYACSAVSLHTVNSASSRRGDVHSRSPAATQFASPLSTIVASPSPDRNASGDDNVDAGQAKVSYVIWSYRVTVSARMSTGLLL